ncbi:MAG: DUF116 domain-containing protein [Candidatus Hodarchaeota archaeon]
MSDNEKNNAKEIDTGIEDLRLDLIHKIGRFVSRAATFASFGSVSDLAKKVVTDLGIIDERWINFTTIEAANLINRGAYMRVPTEKKILLIPHCLRNVEKCKAPIDEEGYHCKKCGACVIAEITRMAEERGMKWYMVGGGSIAMKIVRQSKPGAVLGIACFDEAKMALEKLSRFNVPSQAILLKKAGCVSTEVDLNTIAEKLTLEEQY